VITDVTHNDNTFLCLLFAIHT